MIYLIRHAPTSSNLTGIMVKNYSAQDILPFDKKVIEDNIPKNIDKVYTSKAIRAKQTAEVLYPNADKEVLPCLNEFDCHGIGDKKFWEMNEEEFNTMIQDNVNSDIMVNSMIEMWSILNKIQKESGGDVVCISHGLKIRTFIHFLKLMQTGDVCPENFNPYRLINSMDEKFCNLDVLVVSTSLKRPGINFNVIESGVKTHGFSEKIH